MEEEYTNMQQQEQNTEADNVRDILLVVDIRQIEEIINKILEFNKKFLHDEEGNKLTSWSIGGYLKQISSYIQEGFNTLIDSGSSSYRIFEDIIKQFALDDTGLNPGLIESEKYRKLTPQSTHTKEQKTIIDSKNIPKQKK